MSRSISALLARSFVVVAVALVASSCNSTTSPFDQIRAPVLTTLTPLWESNLEVYPAGEVRPPPAVVARDQLGRAMAGVRVSFAVTAGGGTLGFPDAITSADGIARLGGWTLGPEVGENVVTATVGQSFTVHFRLVSKPIPDGDPYGDACRGCWDYSRSSR